MQIEIYVQARMGSSRLPGKVLRTVLGKPLLGYLIERLREVKEANALAILTTTSPEDDCIVAFCEQERVPCYRGSEEDVLGRYYQTLIQRHPNAIVRITGDCPLIDPDVVDQLIRLYKKHHPNYDYMSNTLELTYPRGLDAEIFSSNTLIKAFEEAKDPAEREHVTLYIYRHPEQFRLKNLASDTILSQYRWTVDTAEDFALIKNILENLYLQHPHFRLNDVVKLLQQHPQWIQLNAHIQQKKVSNNDFLTSIS
jgi:spore coat polysaccharide biosynthesis protein SpsF